MYKSLKVRTDELFVSWTIWGDRAIAGATFADLQIFRIIGDFVCVLCLGLSRCSATV